MLLTIGSVAVAQDVDQFSDALKAAPQTVSTPSTGERVTVSAGEPLLQIQNVRLAEGAKLTAPALSPPKVKNAFVLPEGSTLYRVDSSTPFKACWTKIGPRGWPPCLLDYDGDGSFDRAASTAATKAYPLSVPASYERTSVTLPPASLGLTKAILYQGATKDGINLSYREFAESFARPAFTEELTIPLAGSFPTKISVKGVVFTLHSIDGLGVTFTVEEAGTLADMGLSQPPL